MRIFLSSTFRDLIEHRRRVSDALQRLGQENARMEIFGARPEEPIQACLNEIDQSDLVVGIYAHRYGHVPEGSQESITEMEFRHALRRKKTILCFVVSNDHPWLPDMIESEPGRTKLREFKELLSKHLVIDTFTTPDDLALRVATSTGRYLAEIAAPLYPLEALHDRLEKPDGVAASDREAAIDALSAAVEIANRTLQYIAAQRANQEPDFDEERALADGWSRAGLKLMSLQDPPRKLAERYFLKAEYWSDPAAWTDEQIESAQLRLDAITKESRDFLLNLGTGQAQTAKNRDDDAHAALAQFNKESLPLVEALNGIHLTSIQRRIMRELISPNGTKVPRSMMNLSIMYSKSEVNELFSKGLITIIGRDVVVAHDVIASFLAKSLYERRDDA